MARFEGQQTGLEHGLPLLRVRSFTTEPLRSVVIDASAEFYD